MSATETFAARYPATRRDGGKRESHGAAFTRRFATAKLEALIATERELSDDLEQLETWLRSRAFQRLRGKGTRRSARQTLERAWLRRYQARSRALTRVRIAVQEILDELDPGSERERQMFRAKYPDLDGSA